MLKKPSDELRAPKAMERVSPARSAASHGSRQKTERDKIADVQASSNGNPLKAVAVHNVMPKEEPQANTGVLRAISEPDAEPTTISKDAIIEDLRQQLAKKERHENMYKDKILSLRHRLESLETQHGALTSFASEHEHQIASPVLQRVPGVSEVLGSSSPPSFTGSGSATVGARRLSHALPTRLSPAPHSSGILLSGRTDPAAKSVSDANSTVLIVGHSPQRMNGTMSVGSMTVPLGLGQISLSGGSLTSRNLSGNALIATRTSGVSPPLVHYS
jgi:hypothetical protein